MIQYFRIENGKIIDGPMPLPESFSIYSNLALRSAAELLLIGFYPLVDIQPTHDTATQFCTLTGYTLGSSSVATDYAVSDLPLSTVKSNQIGAIKIAFDSASIQPVTDANGTSWSGGQSSGNVIFLACQLAQQAGSANVTLWDSSNNSHTMTIAEGMTIAATIGATFQSLYQKWQTLRAEINASTTVASVLAITW